LIALRIKKKEIKELKEEMAILEEVRRFRERALMNEKGE
jgi:hypothetical protein